MDDEVLEFPDSSVEDYDTNEVLRAITKLRTDLKNFLDEFAKKKKKEEDKYKYPYPKSKYPYPKKMEEWIEDPAKFEAFEKDIEKEREDFKAKIEELTNKVSEFETAEKEKKINQLLTDQEAKGLIQPEMKESLFKNYSEKFSPEQIDTLIQNLEKMDFSKVEVKAKKGEEHKGAETKSFSKRREELIEKIADLESAGVGGPVMASYKEELEEINSKLN